jgi:hypothetical protein
MTRGSLLVICILVLALAGMFFWTLNLEQRLTESGTPDESPNRQGNQEERLRALENRVAGVVETAEGNEIRIRELSAELEDLSTSPLDRPEPLAGGPEAESIEEPAATPAPAQLKKAVEEVLREKEAEERHQRSLRAARGMSRWLLAEVDATDEQRDHFVQVVAAYYDSRFKVREKYQGDSEDESRTRDEELKTLEEDRNRKLLGIFGASAYQKIEERLNRTRGRGDRGRGGRR